MPTRGIPLCTRWLFSLFIELCFIYDGYTFITYKKVPSHDQIDRINYPMIENI